MYSLSRKSRSTLPPKLYMFLVKFTRTRNLALLFGVASMVSVLATYLAITSSSSPFGPNPNDILVYIIVNLIFILGFVAVISKRIVGLIAERRKGSVGSLLQTRIVLMFSLVAIIPSVTMAIFSVVFFNHGVQSWFDTKVSTAIEGSVAIAESYLEEHKKIIRSDILVMANDLNRDAYNIRKNPRSFSKKLSLLANLRKLPEAIVFKKEDNRKAIIARTTLSFSLRMILENMPDKIFKKAENGELIILTKENDDRVIAIIRLENYFDSYLLVGRFVDTNIISHIETTKGAASEYTKLKSDVADFQIKLFIIFVIVALLLLLAVVWFGFIFAVALVNPIRGLVTATERVKEGDLSARVREGHEDNEIATLGRAFNSMAEQLEHQRKELISAQRRSAWSDVARRIAHEIKNPLTPIQLATDRLRRKYSDDVNDSKIFVKYVDTISRNVSSIGNMVEEFVSFARIPQPVFKDNDICELVEDVIFSSANGSNNVSYICDSPKKPIIITCDHNQITRVMINLLKNSEESVQERLASDKRLKHGSVTVKISYENSICKIEIRDNGTGFSDNMINRLTEPYVTTKSKGTGLGLAIAKKIIEDHNGSLIFANIEGGACVYISFPLDR